jgi:hypothetical protein
VAGAQPCPGRLLRPGAQLLVSEKKLKADGQAWLTLVDRYDGNGLALKIVGETILQVYDGDVAAFLADASARYGTVFGGIRRVLDAQIERLSPVENNLLRRLGVEREPISLADLSIDVAPGVSRSAVLDAIETLRRRSLVEQGERGATFTLQPMVLEYVTDRLVETVADEIERGEPMLLIEQPLIKAQAKEYVRQAQERLIGMPVLQWLLANMRPDLLTTGGLREGLSQLARDVLARHGLDVQLSLASEPDMPVATKDALVLISREALQNIVRHAKADRVDVVVDIHVKALR